MPLTKPQTDKVWELMLDAEKRACYYGEQANRESTIKRIITGVSFFVSSAAVVTILSNHPKWSLAAAIIVAAANGYAIAVNQDNAIKTLARLHTEWLNLQHRYEDLWSHTEDEDAEDRLNRYLERELDLSSTGATEVGLNKRRWNYWVDIVNKKHDTSTNEQPT